MKDLLNKEGIRKEFLEALPAAIADRIDPGIIELGWIRMNDPGVVDAMLDLHMDYGNNMEHYPMIQDYFRTGAPPALLLWGTRDQFLSTQAADAYKRDLQKLEVRLMDGGHWMLESRCQEIAEAVRDYLSRHISYCV